MNVLMVGVGPKRVGGMWTVSKNYLESKEFNDKVRLYYVATSTEGSKIRRLLKMLDGYARIFWHLLFNKIDVVHLHMAEKGSTFRKGAIAKLAKKFGKKVVVHMHAGPFMAWYGTQNEKIQKSIVKIFDSADCVIALGEYWKKQLASIIDEKKIVVIYNGVHVPEKNLYNPNAKDIVYFGVLKKAKGIFDLLDAVQLIDDQLEADVKFKLCGVDPEGNVAGYIADLGIENRVQMLGWVNEEQRENILRNAAISVLPSYFEAFSMTILEAMAHGVPMLTTEISTMGEALGEEIKRFEPGDAQTMASLILELVNNPELRSRWSEIEFQRAKTMFSIATIMENTYSAYQSL